MAIDVRGKVVVLTGRFTLMTRKEASVALTARGATIARSVTASTDCLFVGEKAGSKKAKAEKLGIEIYSETDLVAVLKAGEEAADTCEEDSGTDATTDEGTPKPKTEIADGEMVEVQGSARKPYQLKNIGGVYSCSCPAWRNQSPPIERRTCKHLISIRGREAEQARVGDAMTRPPKRSSNADAPGLLLAHSWEPHVDPTGWWISEKLDGVRAYWDGEQFYSRQGNRYIAPDWFVAGLPNLPLDGELWMARGAFQRTVSIVRRHDASEHWKEIRFFVFDAPTTPGDFETRNAHLATLITDQTPYATLVAQTQCKGVEHLQEELARIEALSGEGLMLREPESAYVAGRSHTLLKVKSFHDAEARVVGFKPGAGRHKGRVGALYVIRADGVEFAVGTGLSDAERESPPPIGSVITYRFQELTDAGVPRFPSFIRIREDIEWADVIGQSPDTHRFYGLPLSSEVVDACTQRSFDTEDEDLVTTHLARNHAYFGGVDKTLSGFVVLDDAGDDYTLLDVRGGGQVYWQDHESREIELQFDSLADYLDCKAVIERAEAADDDTDDREIRRGYAPKTRRMGNRIVSTPELAERYQWLVWALAQPSMLHGVPIQSVEDLVGSALGLFQGYWTTDAKADAAFEKELSSLDDDPHLAVYWLLHATLKFERARRTRTLEAVSNSPVALVRAFAETLGAIGRDGDLSAVPDFRARRSLLVLQRARGQEGAAAADSFIDSLAIDGEFWGMTKAILLSRLVEGGEVSADHVALGIAGIPTRTPALALVRARLAANADGSARKGATEDADTVARALVDANLRWDTALEALSPIRHLVSDVDALSSLADRFFDQDPYHRRIVEICIRAQTLRGDARWGTQEALAERLDLATRSIEPMERLLAAAEAIEEVDALEDRMLRAVLVRRVLLHAESVEEARVLEWAFAAMEQSDEADRHDVMGAAFSSASAAVQQTLLETISEAIDGVSHPFVDLLLGVLEASSDPESGDLMAGFALKKQCESVAATLAPLAHEPQIFDRVAAILERRQGQHVLEALLSTLFNPFTEHHITERLDDARAARVLDLLITLRQQENIHVRNTAGHQLGRFGHVGCEAQAIAALGTYGERYATGEDALNDLMANLYGIVGRLDTPTTRQALRERLFEERRAYWYLGSVVGKTFDAHFHQEVMKLLADRRDADAAAAYTAALVGFVEKAPPMLELAHAVAAWPEPSTPESRSRVKYVLLEGARIGLESNATEIVRAAMARASTIREAPYSPYHSVDRKKPYTDPFAPDSPLRSALDKLVSGEADAERDALRANADAARKKGKPKAMSDAALGALAGATVATRIFVDKKTKEVWFFDTDANFHYFDGYNVVTPPFTVAPITVTPYPRQAIVLADHAVFLEGVTGIRDRALFWDKSHGEFDDWTRYDDRVEVRYGVNNGIFCSVGVHAESEEAAARLMEAVRRSPKKGMSESSPWYVPGKGAVARTYYTPLPGGGYNKNGSRTMASIDGEEDETSAIDAYELTCLRDHGGGLGGVGWSENLRRSEDLSLVEWLHQRCNSTEHVGALTEIGAYLETHGYTPLIEDMEMEVGTGAGDAAIASFVTASEQPLPEELRTFWHSVGHARWRCGALGITILGPTQVLDRREEARALGQSLLEGIPAQYREANAGELQRLDILAIDAEGSPSILYIDHDSRRVFTKAKKRFNDFFMTESLLHVLATYFVHDLVDTLLAATPVLRMSWFGQTYNPEAVERRLTFQNEKSSKFWNARYDPEAGILATHNGKIGMEGKVTVKRVGQKKGRAAFDKAVASKLKGGYVEG